MRDDNPEKVPPMPWQFLAICFCVLGSITVLAVYLLARGGAE